MTTTAPRCGPLDVGDRATRISTAPVPPAEIDIARTAGTHSPAYDGRPLTLGELAGRGVAHGSRTLVKAQHREHERLGSAIWFDSLRERLHLPIPALLDWGEAPTPSGTRWWLVLRRVHGEEGGTPTPARLRALGAALRVWHEEAHHHGLRLDDPGGVGVQLGSLRGGLPQAYQEAAAMLDETCRDMPMTAVHGDVGVGHNALFDGDNLVAVLDPGAVHVAPPMMDLAWCLAVDGPRGGDEHALLDGYGRDAVDADALEALRPHLYMRRLVDMRMAGDRTQAGALSEELAVTRPDLLALLTRA